MSHPEDRLTAALLAHTDRPDYRGTPVDELLDRLATTEAQRLRITAEWAGECVALIEALRSVPVPFGVIATRTGIPASRVHRWAGLATETGPDGGDQ